MNRQSITVLAIVAVTGGSAWVAWRAAAPGDLSFAQPVSAPSPAPASPNTTAPMTPGTWVPPQGDPVEKFQAAKTSAERKETMGAFMALGHASNRFMLIAALADADPSVRMDAIQYCASLAPEEAREVYARAVLSPDKDVREMTWSLVAPHPIENRAMVYGEAIASGGAEQAEEAFNEMGRTPEKPLFEMMMIRGLKPKDAPRGARILKEMQDWLVPGGGDVPRFSTIKDLSDWWAKQARNYDQYMLRVDL